MLRATRGARNPNLQVVNTRALHVSTMEDKRSWQEYPTEPLDKIPARQAAFELAGKKKHLLVSWLGNLNERLAS